MLGVFGLSRMLLRIGWSWLRSFFRGPRYFFVGPLAPDFKAVNRHILAPGIEPIIDRVVGFSFDEVAAAIRYIRSHRATGKVVISFE